MKTMIINAVRMTVICLILFSGLYTALIWGIAQIAPDRGKGEKISDGNAIYYANVGQSFTEDKWFNSRPSAVAYNAAGSGGSNKGPSNPDYLAEVKARIDTFLIKNPGVSKKEIPAELVTASASGLDPHISVSGARIQIERIAKARNLSQDKLQKLIDENTENPVAGLFGPKKVNVLKLNLALNSLN
jgi:K+-transporting ATPase ATPase C chain